jgi:hypothetical protein
VIPQASWIFTASCSRLPDICCNSSSLILLQFSLAETINWFHLSSTCSQFIYLSWGIATVCESDNGASTLPSWARCAIDWTLALISRAFSGDEAATSRE